MPDLAADPFASEADPDHPGWYRAELRETGRFNEVLGPLIVRRIDDRRGEVRMLAPAHGHTNLMGALHGGALLSFIDVSLFAGARIIGLEVMRGQTVDLSVQFIATGQVDVALDAQIEVLRETGRLLFLRGLLAQADATVAAFSATLRKPSTPR